MTELEFDLAFDNCDLDEQYADHIMENCHGDRLICNGDTLVEAMEDLYLIADFKEACLDGKVKINS